MKLFLSFTRMQFQAAFIYRQEFLRILDNLVIMYGAYWLWNTLYTRHPGLFPVSREQMITYGMLAMLMDTIFSATNVVRWTIMGQVRTGAIQMDLLRPLDYLFHQLARNVGQMGFYILTLGLPGFLTGALLLGLGAPAGFSNGALFLLSMIPAYLIAFALNFLLGTVAVYTINIQRIGWVYYSLVGFFSGQLIPLWFFPAFLARVVNLLPFRCIIGIPLSIYIGRYSFVEAAQALGIQIAWAAGLLIVCRLAWKRAHAHLTVQGG
jgi:viologen exporter family transport system permease protein